MKLWSTLASFGIVMLLLQAPSAAAVRAGSALDRGFDLLYNLDFTAAQQQFNSYEQEHPDDPLGPTSEAAGVLLRN
jgi:hypothetical protein